jgi:hypothetical protein
MGTEIANNSTNHLFDSSDDSLTASREPRYKGIATLSIGPAVPSGMAGFIFGTPLSASSEAMVL